MTEPYGTFRLPMAELRPDARALAASRAAAKNAHLRWGTVVVIAVIAVGLFLVAPAIDVPGPPIVGFGIALVPSGAAGLLVLYLLGRAIHRRADRRALEGLAPLRERVARALAADGHAEAGTAADDLLLRGRFERDGVTYVGRADGEVLGIVVEG